MESVQELSDLALIIIQPAGDQFEHSDHAVEIRHGDLFAGQQAGQAVQAKREVAKTTDIRERILAQRRLRKIKKKRKRAKLEPKTIITRRRIFPLSMIPKPGVK